MGQDILLVEDNANDVELTLREFEVHDVHDRVLVLRDGMEAFKHLLRQAALADGALPRAILIGWKLPKLDGLELLRRLKDTEQMQRIPTYLLLSSPQDVAHLAQQDVQPDGYLVKPTGCGTFARDLARTGHPPGFEAAPTFKPENQ